MEKDLHREHSNESRGRSRERLRMPRATAATTRSSSYSDFSSPSPSPLPTKRSASPAPPLQQPRLLSNRVHIERLTRNVSREHLAEIFGAYGRIVDIRHHQLRGWAHIEFVDETSASRVIRCMDGGQIDGNVVVVSVFREPEKPSSYRHGRSRRRSVSPRRY